MLVDPAEMDGPVVLEDEVVYDLRSYAIAPLPAAATRGDDENEEDDESEDDADDSEENSDEDSDESENEDDEDEDDKAATAKLIKQLREENKARRLKLRAALKESERLKAENARLKKAKGNGTNRRKADEAEEEDEQEDDDPTKLTDREKQVEIKDRLIDVMQELDINKKNRRLILALVDEEDIDFEVNDIGKVKVSGLKEAVEELLEDYPEWKNPSDDDEDEGGTTRRTSSGNRKRKGSGSGLDKASLSRKYPALASR